MFLEYEFEREELTLVEGLPVYRLLFSMYVLTWFMLPVAPRGRHWINPNFQMRKRFNDW